MLRTLRDLLRLGDEDYLAIQFMKQMNHRPTLRVSLLLKSTGDIAPALLDSVTVPTS